MAAKRFIVEIGTGVDLHGEDVTAAACRAVKDAISRSCLCGLVEILALEKLEDVNVDILIATPEPQKVDLDQVALHEQMGICFGRKPQAFTPTFKEVKKTPERYM